MVGNRAMVCLVLAILCTFFFVSCSTQQEPSVNNRAVTSNNGVESLLKKQLTESAENSVSASGADTSEQLAKEPNSDLNYDGHIDIDLTGLSTQMVYSMLVNIWREPGTYEGKVIRMCGLTADVFVEEEDTLYHACLVFDETACCSQGLEYLSAAGDYPSDQTLIEVTGVFTPYTINDTIYYTLDNAMWNLLE